MHSTSCEPVAGCRVPSIPIGAALPRLRNHNYNMSRVFFSLFCKISVAYTVSKRIGHEKESLTRCDVTLDVPERGRSCAARRVAMYDDAIDGAVFGPSPLTAH
jgi:hypothetical protein